MTRSQKTRIMVWLAVTVTGGVLGYIYTAIAYPVGGDIEVPALRGLRAGFMVAGATSGFELFAMRGRIGRWLKSMSLWASLAVRVTIHTVMITILLQINIRLVWLWIPAIEAEYRLGDMVADIVFSLAAMSAVLFVIQMRELIGPRTFGNLLTGRYHKPQREERIFGLFDIVGSSAAAQKLGDEAFHDFVSQIFFDIDAPIVDHGGEVMSFVGDALIADWPLQDAKRNSQTIVGVYRVLEMMTKRAETYEQRFGVRPRLRVALHGGPVVAGETGDSKRQITYLGDVLNVASRIEGVAKRTGSEVTISDSLLARCDLPAGIGSKPLGGFDLKGVGAPVGISELVREAM